MPYDIAAESQKQTPWGNMLKEVLNSDFSLCNATKYGDEVELIFHDSKHGLLMYVFSIASSIRILRIYGEISTGYDNMNSKQKDALHRVNIYEDSEEYIFFELDDKNSFSYFINEFITLFDFCNPWHSTLDHVCFCAPGEIGMPGNTYPKIITDSKISSCGSDVKKMIPNAKKTNWFTYYEKPKN